MSSFHVLRWLCFVLQAQRRGFNGHVNRCCAGKNPCAFAAVVKGAQQKGRHD